MSNASCLPPDRLPDPSSLPISSVLNYAYIHGQNASDSAMVACCAPLAVQLLDACYEYCILPAQYTNTSDARHNATASFTSCLKDHGGHALAVGVHVSAATSSCLPVRIAGILAFCFAYLLLYY